MPGIANIPSNVATKGKSREKFITPSLNASRIIRIVPL
jgi:hypothetical protein